MPQTWLLTLTVIALWGLIPILDKLALNAAPASALTGLAIRAGVVAAVALPLAVFAGNGLAELRALPPRAIALYVASGVTSLLLAQYAYYALLRQAEVSRVFPMLFAATPVVTMAIAYLALGEQPTPVRLAGAALVIGGSLLLL